jgi:glutathione S-transferase
MTKIAKNLNMINNFAAGDHLTIADIAIVASVSTYEVQYSTYN